LIDSHRHLPLLCYLLGIKSTRLISSAAVPTCVLAETVIKMRRSRL